MVNTTREREIIYMYEICRFDKRYALDWSVKVRLACMGFHTGLDCASTF